jgi:hypothetical protein
MRVLPALIVATALGSSPAAAQTIGTLEEHARHLTYGTAGTGYGARLHVIVEADGALGDLLISAELEEGAGAQAGTVYSLASPTPGTPAELGGTYFERGDAASRRLGRALASGDFDGDGRTDVVFGANDRRLLDFGSVLVRWGDGSTDGRLQVIETQTDSFGGTTGATLSVADLDDDGLDDLIVGTPRAYVDLSTETSRIQIFYGSAEVGPFAPGDLPDWPSVTLTDESGIAGEVVSAHADWNCDGLPDLLVGGIDGRLFLLLNSPGGWPTDTTVRSPDHYWIELLGSLASANLKAIQLSDLTGDDCDDILLGLAEASDGRGEVVLVNGRSTAEWGPSEGAKELEEIAWIRRRGALPGSLTGWAVEPVAWLTVEERGGMIKPDLLVSAPAAVSDVLDFEATGRLLFIPGTAIFGPHGVPVVKDAPGTLPIDHPRLEDLSPFLFEGRTVGLALGLQMETWTDIDGDMLPDVVVSTPGFRLVPDGSTPEGAVFLIESSLFVDQDGDGAAPYEDCDDADPEVFPGAEELCDREDNDCNGVPDAGDPGVDTESDQDGDGISICEGDCDDTTATTYPGAEELCNGVDDDCDDRVDEVWDADGDGSPDASAPDCAELAEAGGADCDDARGCACASITSPTSEVAGLAWVLLAMGSFATRRRRTRRG